MSKTKCLLLILACVAVLAPNAALAVLQVGDPAPNFTVQDTAYRNHSLTDYRGKVVTLLFWQSG